MHACLGKKTTNVQSPLCTDLKDGTRDSFTDVRKKPVNFLLFREMYTFITSTHRSIPSKTSKSMHIDSEDYPYCATVPGILIEVITRRNTVEITSNTSLQKTTTT